MTIRITFEIPDSMTSFSDGSNHAREFEGVPRPVAQNIAADAVRHAKSGDDSVQQKIYRYRRVEAPDQPGEEVMLPLDFDEVIGLSVARRGISDARTS